MINKIQIKGIEFSNKLVKIKKPFPLMGHIGFGIIDRGYNNLQVRITSTCNLGCIFCSVDAGIGTKRKKEIMVTDPKWMKEWILKAVKYKGPIHLLFDGAGDPITNPLLPKFISEARKIPGILTISLETRLHGATKKTIDSLARAGINRINLSIDSLQPDKARWLSGHKGYNITHILQLAHYAHEVHGIDVHVTPVWIPKINDEDIIEIIEYFKNHPTTRKYPQFGIQKYNEHRHGRKIKDAEEWSWDKFFSELKKLEEKTKTRLILTPKDYELEPAPRIPVPYSVGQVIKLQVVSEVWFPNEYLSVSLKYDWAFTLISKKTTYYTGDIVKGKVIRDKDGILIVKPI